jgi:uncharacterized membrane protein
MRFELWHAFVLGAVLSWGVYVPVLHEGQSKMGAPRGPSAGSVRAFLCVGLAYFLTAVVIPLILLLTDTAGGERLDFSRDGALNTPALTFATLGGIAGAAGALCIILAIKNGGTPLYIAPLVFAGAPIVNAIVSLLWHPPPHLGEARFLPGWIMFGSGILLAAVGAGLVLYAKGYIDQKAREAKLQAAPAAVAQTPAVPPQPDTGIQVRRDGFEVRRDAF